MSLAENFAWWVKLISNLYHLFVQISGVRKINYKFFNFSTKVIKLCNFFLKKTKKLLKFYTPRR